MPRRGKRWSWYGQTLEIALAAAGLVLVGAMIYRWDFPTGGILLCAFLVGGITSDLLIEGLIGRWAKQRDPA